MSPAKTFNTLFPCRNLQKTQATAASGVGDYTHTQVRDLTLAAAGYSVHDAELDSSIGIRHTIKQIYCSEGAAMTDPEHPILKEIRRRAQAAAAAPTPEEDAPKKKKRELKPFVLDGTETRAEIAAKAGRYLGIIDRRNKRTVELAELLELLKSGKHVQNRTLENNLTADEFAEIDRLWQQQIKMRTPSSKKPQALKTYEAWLKQASFYDTKARGEEQRGRYQAAAKSKAACIDELQQLYNYTENEIRSDPEFATWLDRPLPEDRSSLTVEGMPRSITSLSTKAKRMTILDCKIAAVDAALERHIKIED